MKKTILAGMLAAMMLTSSAVSVEAGADNCVTAPASTGRVRLSRLKDCTVIYPQFAKPCGEPYVAALTKDRTIKGKLELYDGETLYIPSGTTLTLNSGAALYGGTVFVEKGASLVLKKQLYIYDQAALICDGRINVGRQGSIHVRNGGMMYSSPESTIKLNADSFMYSSDYATNVCLGEVIKINGLYADTRRTFLPSVVSAVRTTAEIGGDVLTTETLSPEGALKLLSAKWYTLSEIPAGEVSEMLTVLFDNGSSMRFSFMRGRLLGIQGTSVRDIWAYSLDMPEECDDTAYGTDSAAANKKFTAGQLDSAACRSCNVVTAKLDSFSANDDHVDYKFTVTRQLKGETVQTICVKRDREWSDEFTQEFDKGGEYLLFLNPVDYVYKDLYYTLNYSLSARVIGEELASVRYNGGNYYPADEISTITKVAQHIKDNADMDLGEPIGGAYIHSTDINDIVKQSPYIVKVKITDEIEKFLDNDDVSIFTVDLEESYKLETETPLKIILGSDRVKIGGEYVIMLFSYPSGWEPRHYQESSKNSVYKPDDPALKAEMKNAGLL